jgi:tRNA threonylcarbamoyl adenosine modification protein YeaZ
MILLAIDTAGIDCSAALFDSAAGTLLSAVSEEIGKGHAERLMAVIDRALDKAEVELDAVEKIAVVIGPGSFTGIRVGVAAARGFALSLGIDCVGVSTLEVLAASYRAQSDASGPVVVAIDAKRDEIYAQGFAADGSPLTEPAALSLDDVERLAASLSTGLTGSWISKSTDRFDIGMVARLGAAKNADGTRPKPLYLRGPDAKPQTGFALARA